MSTVLETPQPSISLSISITLENSEFMLIVIAILNTLQYFFQAVLDP